MPAAPRHDRVRADACPGAWRRHDAADGALARFRPVGGALGAAALRVLAGAAAMGGSPLEVTSRGSVQVRGLDPATADDLAEALRSPAPDALVDEAGRDVPCTVLASPRAGHAVGEAARAVAAGLRTRPDVPGRLLVAVDDGSGDVTGQGADVAVVVGSRDAALLLDGVDTGLRDDDAAPLVLAAVEGFLAARGSAWRLAEVPDGPARVVDGVRSRRPGVTVVEPSVRPGPADPARLGRGPDGTVEVLPRLGELETATVAVLTELLDAGASLRVTPWRTLVLRDLADPDAARDRLAVLTETDPGSPWRTLSACVGAPRCAKSHADVRGDLAAAVAAGRAGGGQVRAHWIGCHRACGTPGGRFAVLEALAPEQRTALFGDSGPPNVPFAAPGGAPPPAPEPPRAETTATGVYRAVVRAGRVSR